MGRSSRPTSYEKGCPEDLGSEWAASRSYNTFAAALRSVREALLHDDKPKADALTGMVGRMREDLVAFYPVGRRFES